MATAARAAWRFRAGQAATEPRGRRTRAAASAALAATAGLAVAAGAEQAAMAVRQSAWRSSVAPRSPTATQRLLYWRFRRAWRRRCQPLRIVGGHAKLGHLCRAGNQRRDDRHANLLNYRNFRLIGENNAGRPTQREFFGLAPDGQVFWAAPIATCEAKTWRERSEARHESRATNLVSRRPHGPARRPGRGGGGPVRRDLE